MNRLQQIQVADQQDALLRDAIRTFPEELMPMAVVALLNAVYIAQAAKENDDTMGMLSMSSVIALGQTMVEVSELMPELALSRMIDAFMTSRG